MGDTHPDPWMQVSSSKTKSDPRRYRRGKHLRALPPSQPVSLLPFHLAQTLRYLVDRKAPVHTTGHKLGAEVQANGCLPPKPFGYLTPFTWPASPDKSRDAQLDPHMPQAIQVQTGHPPSPPLTEGVSTQRSHSTVRSQGPNGM